MKLRHNTTQNHLKEMSSWLEGCESKRNAARYKTDKTLKSGEEEEKKQQNAMSHKQNAIACTKCGDVFSSKEILTLHTCETTSEGSEEEDESTTSTNCGSESSSDE